MRRRLAVLVLLAAGAAPAAAHPLAPSLLDLTEERGGRVTALWRRPQALPVGARPEPLLPARCRAVAPAVESVEGAARVRRWTADCGAAGLAGGTVAVAGLADAGSDVLLRAALADGTCLRAVLRPDAPSFVLPADQRAVEVAAGYLTLGVEHLLGGWDHLAFVLGLVLLVRRRPCLEAPAPGEDRGWERRRPARSRRLLGTITAFTLGHSVTLSLATLGLVRLPPAPIEAAIALSILILAVELTRDRAGALGRRPWLMAAGFGLLHGLGFAGALADVGLPAREIPLALLAFNVGIELGQIAFVVAILAAAGATRRLLRQLPAWSAALPTYAIGTLAAYWMFERLASL